MASLIPKDRTVAALDEVWSSITELLVGLDDEQWSLPSPLPGWDVQDNVAHIVGTEAMLLGIENPDIEIDRDELPHVQNDIGVFNELWVQYLRMRQPNEVLSIFEEYTGARLAALLEMTLDELDAAREWMLLLGRKTAREKIASLLVILARRDAALRAQGAATRASFDLPLTREAMADYLGLTLETVSRQISALKRDGVIGLVGTRRVDVPDMRRLIDEAGDDSHGGMPF